jgi:uncharacterized membrane protein YdjX (TVP38/TMEM64 family)
MPEEPPARRGRRLRAADLRPAAFAALVLGGTGAFAVLGAPDPDRLAEFTRGLGPFGAVCFVLAAAALTVLTFPKPVLAIAAGTVFGAWVGTLVVVTGATLGATGAFLLSRRFGRARVLALGRGRLASVDGWLGSRGFVTVLCLRLFPLAPFSLVNYAVGGTSVRLRDFLPATAVGIVPGTYVFAALGGSYRHPEIAPVVTAVVFGLVLVVAGPLLPRLRGSLPPPPGPAGDQ